jgi:hypothetical protein
MQYVTKHIAAWLSNYSSSRSVLSAYGASAFWVVVELIWSPTDVVSQPSMRHLTRQSRRGVFSIKSLIGCHFTTGLQFQRVCRTFLTALLSKVPGLLVRDDLRRLSCGCNFGRAKLACFFGFGSSSCRFPRRTQEK